MALLLPQKKLRFSNFLASGKTPLYKIQASKLSILTPTLQTMAMDMEIDEDIPQGFNGVQERTRKPRWSVKGKGRAPEPTSKLEDEKRTATLHRIRFLDYMPSSILAIALTPQTYDPATHHPYLPSLHSGNGREILAVGRQNGEIEIYTWIGGEGFHAATTTGEKQHRAKRRASLSTVVMGPSSNKQGWVLERVRRLLSLSCMQNLFSIIARLDSNTILTYYACTIASRTSLTFKSRTSPVYASDDSVGRRL